MVKKYKYYLILLVIVLASLGIGVVIGANAFPKTEIRTKTEYVYVEKTSSKLETVDYLGEFVTTAYCDCEKCCGKTDGITATGTKATAGRTIAVDPDVIPYGTEIAINGHSYIAEDCGGAIKGNHIDIFMNDHNTALRYGRRTVDVFLVSE